MLWFWLRDGLRGQITPFMRISPKKYHASGACNSLQTVIFMLPISLRIDEIYAFLLWIWEAPYIWLLLLVLLTNSCSKHFSLLHQLLVQASQARVICYDLWGTLNSCCCGCFRSYCCFRRSSYLFLFGNAVVVMCEWPCFVVVVVGQKVALSHPSGTLFL